MEPKEKPANRMGTWYSCCIQSSAARTSSTSPWPLSCVPSLKPAPRKLKRSTGMPKDWKALHGVVHHLVVHGAPEERVRMADHGRVRGIRSLPVFSSASSRPAGPRSVHAAQQAADQGAKIRLAGDASLVIPNIVVRFCRGDFAGMRPQVC